MTLNLKQHDRRPWLLAQLRNADGTGIDLSAVVSVHVIVRLQAASSPLFKQPCEILTTQGAGGIPATYDDGTPVTNLSGWVRYKWATGNTDTAGGYDVEWEILWVAGDPQTVPTVGYYEVIIGDDLDNP